MKPPALTAVCFSLALLLNGCNSNPNRPHEANLINDKVTSERVKAALSRVGPEFKDVQVTSTNGMVMLSGSVNTEENRSRAESITRNVHRVTNVQDDLRVKP